MAEVRHRLLAEDNQTPQASNVAVTCFADVPRAKNLDAVQIVLSDPHYWGGMRNVQHLSHLTGVLGMGLSMHSNSHLGVSLMAMTHAAAACPNLTYACDTHYPWQTDVTKWWPADASASKTARCAFPTSRAWESIWITTRWPAAASATPRSRTASATTKRRCASTWIPTGNACCRGGRRQL